MKSLRSSKLISLLLSFNEERMRRFGLYLHSPYFNSSKTITSCYDAIAEFYPRFDDELFSLDELDKRVFGTAKDFDYHRINNVLSDVYELALSFLSQLSFDDKDNLERWHVLPRLREARLDKQFEQQLKKYERILDTSANDDLSHLYRNFLLNEKIWYSSARDPESRFEHLQGQYDTILNFVMIRLGRLATLLLFEEYQSSVQFRLPFLSELDQFFQSDSVPDVPGVKMCQISFLLIRYRRDEDYYRLRALRDEYRNFFHASDLGFINTFLNQHVVWTNYEQGRTDLYPYMVEDHKENVVSGHYKRNGVIPYADFVLYVRSACIARDFDWAQTLEDEYLALVIDEERENCLHFSHAVIARTKGLQREALADLQRVNFKLPILALQVRSMSIMIAYELEEFESCLRQMDAFRHYLKSLESLPPRYIVAHQDLLRLLKRLITLHSQARSKQRTEDLRELLNTIQNLPYNTFNARSWLHAQCSGLLNS